MTQQLSWEQLQTIMQAESIDQLSMQQLNELFHAEQQMIPFLPDSICQIDPRDGELIVYNSTRARRPHDSETVKIPLTPAEKPCVICQGKTTGVIDVARLSQGATFINKNLFPIIYPLQNVLEECRQQPLYPDPTHTGRQSYGFHFLQWTSSHHDQDWHNLSLEDGLIVLQRLAALEQKLLYESEGLMPPSEIPPPRKPTHGFVSIIKNHGQLAGGSLAHGHQQIGYSNIMPRCFYNNWCFSQRHQAYFSDYLLRENPAELMIRDYDNVVLIVPYFMRRPYDMLLLLKNPDRQYLHELTIDEMREVTQGIQDAIRALLHIMPLLGRDPAFNMTVNNGPGAGLYLEFFAHTQEIGGFEQLGLWVCQESAINAATYLREVVATMNPARGSRPPSNAPPGRILP
jgi:galactose-1-phosphate uridylyltransferase